MNKVEKQRSIAPKDVKEPEYPNVASIMPVMIGPNI